MIKDMIAGLFILFGWGFDVVGVTAAFVAFLGGRTMSNLYLVGYVPGESAVGPQNMAAGTDEIGPDVGVCLDAFHMNIEESDIAAMYNGEPAVRILADSTQITPRRQVGGWECWSGERPESRWHIC